MPLLVPRHHAISTHALREEGDRKADRPTAGRENFYPRPPRGGRPRVLRPRRHRPAISTHALREEGDKTITVVLDDNALFLPTPSARRATRTTRRDNRPALRFLPTPSARRATVLLAHQLVHVLISTHALREEGDGIGFFEADGGI